MPKRKAKKKAVKKRVQSRSDKGKKASKKKKRTGAKRSGPGKEKDPIDWLLGWRYLSETIPTPTYKQVAEFLKCSVSAVEEHGVKHGWQKALKEIEAEAAEQLKTAASTSIARTKLESLGIVRDLKNVGSLAVSTKDWKPKDVIAYIDAELRLLGEPDIRIDNVSDREAIKEEFREAIRNGEIDVEKLRVIARRRRKTPGDS